MEPVKVKLYGLFAVSRRGYLTQVAVTVFLLVGLLIVWSYLPPPPAPQKAGAASHVIWPLLDALPWVVLALTVWLVLEAVFVLRRFAQKEASLREPRKPSQP